MKIALLMALILVTSAACTQQQGRVDDAIKAVEVPDKTNYFERRQIAEAEALNDRPGKVYWWYILAQDGRLITSYTCIGRPASSTESLEPNNTKNIHGDWKVQLEEGQTGYTSEMMGLDGTYGEPVPFRYCITPEGHYVDVAMYQPSIVSSIPLTFPAPTVRFDEQLEAKKLQAEAAVRAGGCIDSALNTIPCEQVKKNKEE